MNNLNQNSGGLIFLLLLLGAIVFLLIYIRKKFKQLDLPSVFFVSGEVKSGKSLLSVHLAIKEYKRALRRWYIRKWLVKMFFPKRYHEHYDYWDEYKANNFVPTRDIDWQYDELPPMLYSNLHLAYTNYNPLTIDIIERKVRIPNKSVVLIDEVSLFADSQLFKDKITNNKLMMFFKLYGHYSHGGKLIINSQAIGDCHYSLKRCMGSYLYIQDRKQFPLISILWVRQMIYSDDGSSINVVDKDLELDLRKVLIFNFTYKKYDCYALSVFTDYMPYQVKYDIEKKDKHDSLKSTFVVTLNPFMEEVNLRYKFRDYQIVDIHFATNIKDDNENYIEYINKEGVKTHESF